VEDLLISKASIVTRKAIPIMVEKIFSVNARLEIFNVVS
jgi:hypothetical protein